MHSVGRIFLLGTFLLTPFFVSASEKIEVVPAFQDLTLEVGQRLQSEITVSNKTGTNQEFSVRSVSFQSLDASGGVAFLGTDINNDELPSADFIVFESQSLSIPAGETRTFSFQIEDRETLSPGGHYAALVFQSLPVTDENSAQKIAVRQIFSSLIFLNKQGGEKKQLILKPLPDKLFLWQFPKTTELIFVNTGNTHVVPRGTVVVKDTFDFVRARTVLNESSGILLPEQERLFPVNLSFQPWLPGLYTIFVSYRHDGQAEITTIQETFFLLPYRLVIVIGALVAVLILLRKNITFFHKRKKSI